MINETDETPGPRGARPEAQKSIPTAAEATLALLNEGPIRRLETGLESLDKATRGGPMFGKSLALGGAPNAGKTTLAVQLAHRAARKGYAVAIHCADVDDREAVCTRIGQAEGMKLADLEARDPAALRDLARLLAEELPRLIIHDQDEDEVYLEATISALVAILNGGPGVLVVDSIQKARSRLGSDAETEAQIVQSNVSVLKAAAKKHKLLVIFTSELSRGAYRSRRTVENCTDISAFKHSGDIEHFAFVALVLRSTADSERPLTGVVIAKNKRGISDAPFTMLHDRAQCRFVEVPTPEASASETTGTEDELIERAKQRVLRALRRNTNLKTKNDIHGKARGTKTYNLRAIDELTEDGSVVKLDGCYRVAAPSAPEVG